MISSVTSVVNIPLATDARTFFTAARELIDPELDRLIPKESEPPESVHQAIRWSVFAGGKRFRPSLVLAVGQTFGAKPAQLLRTACALEMIHTYSLIHDDLPSMDNDELRRGQTTCHVKFGEATAILAGDALQTVAFQTIAEDEGLPPSLRVRLIAEIARAAGTPEGMVAGQALDLAAESREVTADELELIHSQKTGALIRVSARCGALIAAVPANELAAITEYGARLGLLFQMTDDLLDVTSTADDLGKTPGKDARANKATYPAVYGIEASRERLVNVHAAAWHSLEKIARPVELLQAIADFILKREA
jgi:geranylgeranyl diphosphate synthase type II